MTETGKDELMVGTERWRAVPQELEGQVAQTQKTGRERRLPGLVIDQHGEGAVGGDKGPRCGYWCEPLSGTEVAVIPRGKELR